MWRSTWWFSSKDSLNVMFDIPFWGMSLWKPIRKYLLVLINNTSEDIPMFRLHFLEDFFLSLLNYQEGLFRSNCFHMLSFSLFCQAWDMGCAKAMVLRPPCLRLLSPISRTIARNTGSFFNNFFSYLIDNICLFP